MQRCVQRTRKDETTQRNKTDAEFRKIRHVFDDTLDGCSGEAGAIATPGELDTMRAGWFDGLFGCFRPVLWSLAAKTTGKTDDWEVTYLVSIIWTRYETLDSSNWWTFTLFMDEVTKTSFIQKQIISINCVKTWICLKRMSEKDVTEVLLFQQYFKNNFLRCLPRLKSFFFICDEGAIRHYPGPGMAWVGRSGRRIQGLRRPTGHRRQKGTISEHSLDVCYHFVTWWLSDNIFGP